MTKEEINKSKELLDDIDIKEIERVKIIDRKNAMETLLYEKSTWLEGDQAAKVIKVILL